MPVTVLNFVPNSSSPHIPNRDSTVEPPSSRLHVRSMRVTVREDKKPSPLKSIERLPNARKMYCSWPAASDLPSYRPMMSSNRDLPAG